MTVSASPVAGAAFGTAPPRPALPVSLAAGQTFSLPVTFTPTTYGVVGGTLTVTTSAGPYAGRSRAGPGLSAAALLTVAPRRHQLRGHARSAAP